jgi:hypothetical protein
MDSRLLYTRIQDNKYYSTYNIRQYINKWTLVLTAISSIPKDDKIDTPCTISDNIQEATTLFVLMDCGLWLLAAPVSDPAASHKWQQRKWFATECLS